MGKVLYLTRVDQVSKGIFGTLYSLDGKFLVYTAEHAYKNAEDYYRPKLPYGTYTIKRRFSPHFGYGLFIIMDVPNCSFIEIHKGNDPQIDSKGCILLGLLRTPDNGPLRESRVAFNKFMEYMEGSDEATLVVA